MGRFTQLDEGEFACSLIGSLEADLVDDVRDLHAALGDRPYRVFLVWTRWTGGRRGDGIEEVVRELELLPVPLIAVDGIALQLQNIGMDEIGTAQASELSPRYTEFLLRGLDENGSPLPPNETFYWEVRLVRRSKESSRMRFRPTGKPAYSTTEGGTLEWKVRLTRASPDRDGGGTP